MKRLVLLLAVAVAALNLAASSTARTARWQAMTTQERLRVVQHEIHVHRWWVHLWLNHRARFPASAAAPTVYCRSIGIRAPGAVCLHGQRLVKALHVRTAIDTRLALARAARLAALLPAHHALWMCIHGHEAADWHNQDTGGNGHWGGLQMHPGWGYGTSYHASDDSQQVQERAAESGYRASGYSRSWLYGQWAHPDCMQYA